MVLIGSMLQVVCRVRYLVYLYIFVTNRRVLFRVICNLYLVGKVKELRGTIGYMRAGRMVVSHSLSLLCWLRPERCFSAATLFLVSGSLMNIISGIEFQA